MTLCIAACCVDNEGPCIVLCSDTKIGTSSASAEIADKVYWTIPRWPALISGKISRAAEVLNTFAQHLNAKKTTALNILDHFKAASRKHRRKLIDEYVHQSLGITYERLLKDGKQEVPKKRRGDVFDEIGRLDFEADVIIAGFAFGDPYIFVVHGSGDVVLEEHFAAIGTGADIAEPNMFQRKHSCESKLAEAIYNVYESKRLGQIAEGVGENMYLDVIRPTKTGITRERAAQITEEGRKYLRERYDRFGPKPVTSKDLRIQKSHFSSY